MNIGGIQPFSLCDYPGLISAVVFAQGCNFRCPYCHNKELIPLKRKVTAEFTLEEAFLFLEKRQGQLEGIVISGGEPCLQLGLSSFLKDIKTLGYKIKLDTNGSFPEKLNRLISKGLLDYIAMDVKAPFNKYNKLAGVNVDLPVIHESIEIIKSSNLPHLFRTTWDKSLLMKEDLAAIEEMIPDLSKYIVQECKKTSNNKTNVIN